MREAVEKEPTDTITISIGPTSISYSIKDARTGQVSDRGYVPHAQKQAKAILKDLTQAMFDETALMAESVISEIVGQSKPKDQYNHS